MRRIVLATVLLLIPIFAMADYDPFRDADAAYNNGNYSEALKLYQREAVAATEDTVRAEAWFRSIWVTFTHTMWPPCSTHRE